MRKRNSLLLCLLVAGGGLLLHADEPRTKGPTADVALRRLQDGNKRFVTDQTASRPTFPDQRARLAAKQNPFAVILTCSDSRVVPEFIFNQQLGELFTHRVAGNVTDPALLGSIEYAVEHLHVPLILVMGHSNCGAVQAKVSGGHLEGNLGELIKRVHVGDKLPDDKKKAVAVGVEANVRHHAEQLSRQSKTIKEFVKSGRVKVAGAVYSLETGEVSWLKLATSEK